MGNPSCNSPGNNKNILKDVPGWRWFWGTDKQPTTEEAVEMLNRFDVCVTSGKSVLAIQYDRSNLVAYPHIYVDPDSRNQGKGIELIALAEKIAANDGMRKILAQIPEGNPFFVVGEKSRLGYTLEGKLVDHSLVMSKPVSLFLYGKLLQQNSPESKKG